MISTSRMSGTSVSVDAGAYSVDEGAHDGYSKDLSAMDDVPGEVERLKWVGIYPQKQGGDAFMMRVKVPGGVLTLVGASDIDNLDPHKQSSFNTHGRVGLVYNRLLTFETGPDIDYTEQVIVGDLAEEWDAVQQVRQRLQHSEKQ